ncbi:MAG: galactose mutarotase [Bacteroidales bacterium]|nr:galactose mutarotase [Bacteroidales bacterium]
MKISQLSGLKRKDFQSTIQGKQTDLYTLVNQCGNEVCITNYGGALVAIMVPGKDGKIANVIQGHDTIKSVVESPEPFLSTLIGRYGNRICNGRFQLDGVVYDQLAINNGPNHLHGGPTGFHARVWDAEQKDDQTLCLHYLSKDGEEGFPGNLDVTVVYRWTDDNELVIDYKATTDKSTIINLTNHGFFSLAGIANPTPDILDLQCYINANFYVPIDETSIPTGEVRAVKGTPFDFTQMHAVGDMIDADDEQTKNGAGYDHSFLLNKGEFGELSYAAKVCEPHSGRSMEVYTTEPAVQVYTDNWASGYPGQCGSTFPRRSAICFEAQHAPDTPNQTHFPTCILRPGEVYTQKTVYKFGTDSTEKASGLSGAACESVF